MAEPKTRVRRQGAYIIRAAESRPARVLRPPRPGYVPPQPTLEDRALVAALLKVKGALNLTDPKETRDASS